MTEAVLPRHIAVIMDGNGRWATQRGLHREAGHQAGADAVRALVRECCSLAIPRLTVYAFSRENWGRPDKEITFLFDLFTRFVRDEVPEMVRQGIRLAMIGNRKDLPKTVRTALDYALHKTSTCQNMVFTLALSYSGQEEILHAARALAASGIPPKDFTAENFRLHLYDPTLPDPDLIIRTGGELRLSNFLLFQSAYSELYFSEKWWPDFGVEDLHLALASYAGRQRRFGLLTSDVRQAIQKNETRADHV